VSEDNHTNSELVEEASALIHAGIDRAKSLVKQTAQAIREQLPDEGIQILQDDPQPLG